MSHLVPVGSRLCGMHISENAGQIIPNVSSLVPHGSALDPHGVAHGLKYIYPKSLEGFSLPEVPYGIISICSCAVPWSFARFDLHGLAHGSAFDPYRLVLWLQFISLEPFDGLFPLEVLCMELPLPTIVQRHGRFPICPIWDYPWANNLSSLVPSGPLFWEPIYQILVVVAALRLGRWCVILPRLSPR